MADFQEKRKLSARQKEMLQGLTQAYGITPTEEKPDPFMINTSQEEYDRLQDEAVQKLQQMQSAMPPDLELLQQQEREAAMRRRALENISRQGYQGMGIEPTEETDEELARRLKQIQKPPQML